MQQRRRSVDRPDASVSGRVGGNRRGSDGVVDSAIMTDTIHEAFDGAGHAVVDLFAGPGGLDVAATWLGLPVHGIEWDANANATRRNAGLDTSEGDVRDHGPARFPGATILTGGPPCQTFTVAGSGSGRAALTELQGLVGRMAEQEDVSASLTMLEDERSGLVLEPLRWILEALREERPFEAVVLEQVQAALPVWRAMEPVLTAVGYHVKCAVLRTEEFGVPQTRRRAVLLANRVRPPQMPTPTHQRYRRGVPRLSAGSDPRPWVSMGDVLSRPEPFEVISNYGTGGDPSLRGRRRSSEPAATVTGKVSRNRIVNARGEFLSRFTEKEAGILQTFPANYPWASAGWAQQVGNAVPPRLGAHLLAGALGHSLDPAALDVEASRSWVVHGREAVDLDAVERIQIAIGVS